MNLWVNRIGQLSVLAVALFFFACEDEINNLGYKNPNSKFKVSYVDIPVEVSTILLDSVRTSNFDVSTDQNRWLVGKYSDPRFGEITATAFAEFFPSDSIRTGYKDTDNDNKWVHDTPVLDRITMSVYHDLYAYGANTNTTQAIAVHELTERLVSGYTVTVKNTTGGQHKPDTTFYSVPKVYFNKTDYTFEPTELGSTSYPVDLKEYNEEFDDTQNPDTIVSTFPLLESFGQRLLDLGVNRKDSFRVRSFFSRNFKGLAIASTQADKVIGFNPSSDSTRITLRYHNSKDTFLLSLRFNNLVSYSNITADRNATELASLTNYYEETDLGDLAYIQAGTGVVTKIDFSAFNGLADSDTLERMAINGAEFIIKNIEDPGSYAPPANLMIKFIKDNNRPRKLSWAGNNSTYQDDLSAMQAYRGQVRYNTEGYSLYQYNLSGGATTAPFDSTLAIFNDFSTNFMTLTYSSDKKGYYGQYGSLFFQQLFMLDAEEYPRYTKAILYPFSAPRSATDPDFGKDTFGKVLNRVAFKKDNLVLRVYYTVPTANQNQ